MDQSVHKHISEPLLEIYKILYGNQLYHLILCHSVHVGNGL